MVDYNDLSVEELLKLVSDKTKKKRELILEDDVQKLSRDLGFEQGEDRIDTYIIWHIYKNVWQGKDARKKLKKIYFFKVFSSHYKSGRIGTKRYYLLNKEKLNLSKELIREAKTTQERERKERTTNYKKEDYLP